MLLFLLHTCVSGVMGATHFELCDISWFGDVYVVHNILSSFTIILVRREPAGFFTLIMLLFSCVWCLCADSIPRGAVDWSVVCDCDTHIYSCN